MARAKRYKDTSDTCVFCGKPKNPWSRQYCSIRCFHNYRRSVPRKERFWKLVSVTGPLDCWEWQGYVDKQTGYGDFCYEYPSRHVGAHRFSWTLVHGPIEDGLCVLHRCDNRVCVNPAHLFLGTKDDNNQDMISKGRAFWQKKQAQSGAN